MVDPYKIARFLTERFGLEVDAVSGTDPEGETLFLRPAETEPTRSFRVEFHLNWRAIDGTFIFGNFAAELLAAMKRATPDQKAAFAVFAEALHSKGAKITLKFDDVHADPIYPEQWPSEWRKFSLEMRKVGVLNSKADDNLPEILPWITGFFGLSLALLPFEPVQEVGEHPTAGENEGRAYYEQVKRYERSRINRAACIELHGPVCVICGFIFGKEYGSNAEGFIHVHHVNPLSLMQGEYVLNPAEDLIPICPNCHAIVHRKIPPHTPEEVKAMIESEKEKRELVG